MKNEEKNNSELERNLSNRHIQLIALGGAIGTGLFLGSGKTIFLSGPSILLVYLIIGVMLFFMMRALGEILLSNLNYRSFNDIASDLLGDRAAFYIGWTYWFCWITMGTANIIAVVEYTQKWWPDVYVCIPSGISIILLLTLNLLSVRLFGEAEFWFSMIKISAILFLIGISVYLVVIGFVSPNGDEAKLSNIWQYGGIFPTGVTGFFAGFQISVFAFVGIELVGAMAAEAKNPRVTLPKAINAIPIRIVFFYVFALISIMVITPWININPAKSPFVEVFDIAGISAAAGIVNFVVLTSAASAANSSVYSLSRMIYGLSIDKQAPQIMKKLSKCHVPNNALIFSVVCLSLATFVLLVVPSLVDAFTLITTVSTVCFIFIWIMIMFSYLAYRRKKPLLHAKSIYKMPGGKIMAYFVLGFFFFILVLLFFENDTRMALCFTPIWFVIVCIGDWFYFRNKQI